MLSICKNCGLFFRPANQHDIYCARCQPRHRNKPVDLFERWSDDVR